MTHTNAKSCSLLWIILFLFWTSGLVILLDHWAWREHEKPWRRNQRPAVSGWTGAALHISVLSFKLLDIFPPLWMSYDIMALCFSPGTNHSENLHYEQWQTKQESGNSRRGEHAVTGEQCSGKLMNAHSLTTTGPTRYSNLALRSFCYLDG